MTNDRTPQAAKLKTLYEAGDLDGVVAAARALTAEIETDFDASLVAGLAHAGVGAFGDAAAHLRRAISLNPRDHGARGALARVLLLLGEAEEAHRLMEEMASAAGSDAMAVLHLADTYLQEGRAEDAYHLVAGARRKFDHPLIDARLAETAIRTRRIDEAVAAARRADARLGAHASAIKVAGPAALIVGDGAWARRTIAEVERRSATQAAGVYDFWANMLMSGDKLEPALIAAERAVAKAETSPRWRLVSDLRLAARDDEGAATAAERAVELSPSDAHAMTLLARARMKSGDIAAAKRILLDAIAADPLSAVAFDYLTQVDPGALTADHAASLEDALARGALAQDERPKALLAIARRNEALGEHAKAFSAIIEAKGIIAKAARASGGAYRPEIIDAAVVKLKTIHARPLPSVGEATSPRLIFIIGMPRSGTSLIEQILASHSDVFGAGELPEMITIMGEFNAAAATREEGVEIMSANAAAWRTRYLSALPAGAKAAPVVTDKHPMNFWSVGVIRALFPDAKIINLRRAPVDVCLSILRFRFFAEYAFANSIDDVVHYYAAYERAMAHWRAVHGGAILDFAYEDLVATPQERTRELLGHCGLSWQDACLSFHKTKRTVLTHSAAQVREPINTRAIERRRRYGDVLKPLEDALARYGVSVR